MGSLAPPVFKAENTVLKLTPHISNKTVPPLTRAPQWDTCPLPLPIRIPVGLAVIGKYGKIRIQIFPFLLIFRAIACLADSICLEFKIPASAALSPIVPKFKLLDLNSNFLSLPFLVFLNFIFFGPLSINLFFNYLLLFTQPHLNAYCAV